MIRRRTLTTALTAAMTATAVGVPAASAGPGRGNRVHDDHGKHGAGHGHHGPGRPGTGRLRPRTLADGTGLYPRAIRLAHAGEHDDTLLASVVSFDEERGYGAIWESCDDGSTFTLVGEVCDEATSSGEGLCCATLYELPGRVGDLPAGTLLWSASVGADTGEDRRMSIRVWASHDRGRNWERIAITASAANTGGLWEPEFALAEDGTLVLWFCDETDGEKHSQKIVQQESRDGLTWADPHPVIGLEDPEARPGMPNVRRLRDGRWVMSYEICGPTDLCRVRVRTSDTPLSWGSVTDYGQLVRAVDGTEPRHTPTILVDEDGSILLASQMQYGPDGEVSGRNGQAAVRTRNRTLTGEVRWQPERVPVPVQDPWDNYCPNYSPTFVRARNGRLLEITTTPDADEVCQAWVGAKH